LGWRRRVVGKVAGCHKRNAFIICACYKTGFQVPGCADNARMPAIGVSSWSLNRSLGRPAFFGPERDTPPEHISTLLSLPARIAAHDLTHLELCHFHLPSHDPAALAELRMALADAGVTLHALLIDGGDLTDPVHRDRDSAWISKHINIAGMLGAQTARVIAGKAPPTPEALAASVAGFRALHPVAQAAGVQLTTENFFATTSTPAAVIEILDRCDGALKLKLDFGNWRGERKYDDLAVIAPFAESTHAKASFDAPYAIDADDYRRCLGMMRSVGFEGVHTLIYDDAAGPDEWRGLEIERDMVLDSLR
jgi:sugar phosphate isomerase/epimerase